jgi:hypothetical protein
MKILICGGRDYQRDDRIEEVINKLNQYDCIIQGGGTGADSWAKFYAEKRGLCVIEVKANWAKYGNAAGPIRNKWMLDYCNPDKVIAFPGGKGTENMIKLAKDMRFGPYEGIEIEELK